MMLELAELFDGFDVPLGAVVLLGVCLAALIIVVATANWNKPRK